MTQPVADGGYGPPPPTPRTPGIATTAAVLGFVDAASVLGLVVLVLADTAATGTGGVGIGIGLGAALALGLSAALLLGSLALVRGTGRAVLVGASITQIALSVAFGVVVLLGLGTALDPYGFLAPPGRSWSRRW